MSGLLLWLSGAAWLVLHYYGQVEGEFGFETNPLEPWCLRVHGLALIPTLLGFGGLFVVHMPKGWKNRYQRNLGIALSAVFASLIVTGYMLYYVGNENIREWASFLHWALGLGIPVLFVWHYVHGRAVRRKLR